MKLLARVGLSLSMATGLGVHALLASAQGFPNKPLRLITPVPAGGGVDILSRAIGQNSRKTSASRWS
jgi:tripartite-type tricarboxylate transporter receptor subunit TctC